MFDPEAKRDDNEQSESEEAAAETTVEKPARSEKAKAADAE
jgi:hypothetical protein